MLPAANASAASRSSVFLPEPAGDGVGGGPGAALGFADGAADGPAVAATGPVGAAAGEPLATGAPLAAGPAAPEALGTALDAPVVAGLDDPRAAAVPLCDVA